ncbi:hypothetical protein D7322_27520 [Sphingobacterium puteale]|uniref:Uncharacterized protein n=1 Tax=Sphingobacterium puteale TaxID=2420510 RepID=A0A420VPX2_9SPHI|nr:hypothetical protein [Sphingobacterium puteale]RKO68369.1 hypothetical protein D7322_27520 [Sphingobacterium puteale]
MEDTIGQLNTAYKGQIFRITYQERDFQIQLLKKCPTKEETALDILLDGLLQTLVKNKERWSFQQHELDQDLANHIWRAISLRYRL